MYFKVLLVFVCLFSWIMNDSTFAGACCSKGSSGEEKPLIGKKKSSRKGRGKSRANPRETSPKTSPKRTRKKSRNPSQERRKESPRSNVKVGEGFDDFVEVTIKDEEEENGKFQAVSFKGVNIRFPEGAIVEEGGNGTVVVVPNICRAVLYPDETGAAENDEFSKVRKRGTRPRNMDEFGKILRAMASDMSDEDLGLLFLNNFVPIFTHNVQSLLLTSDEFPVQMVRYKGGRGKSIVEVNADEEHTGYIFLTFPNVEDEDK